MALPNSTRAVLRTFATELTALSDADLTAAWAQAAEILKVERRMRLARATLDLAKGDKVEFTARNRHFVGVVEKVNRTTVTVRVDMDSNVGSLPVVWRVSASLVKRVA